MTAAPPAFAGAGSGPLASLRAAIERSGLPAWTLPAGAIAIVLVAVFAFMNLSGGGSGISYNPSTIPCGSNTSVTVTITLPGSVGQTEQLEMLVDGQDFTPFTVKALGYRKQGDSWVWSTTERASSMAECNIGEGSHTISVADASGKTIATGSFTASR